MEGGAGTSTSAPGPPSPEGRLSRTRLADTTTPGGTGRRIERTPLPRDPDRLPALPRTFWTTLDDALERLDLDLTPGMRTALDAQVRLLLGWAPHVNLTAIRSPDDVAREHVVDSLTAVPLLSRWSARGGTGRVHADGQLSILDLGSGAGYPGLPLAVALPARSATLVDAIRKKADFLRTAAAAARTAADRHGESVPELRVVEARAEVLAREVGRGAGWDVVTARAVAPLEELLELAMPLLRRGGILIAWKRDAGDGSFAAELARATHLAPLVGAGERFDVERVDIPGLTDHRLVVVTKRRPTPTRFPRPPALRRRPLIR